MPDLTLYREDIELIRSILFDAERKLTKKVIAQTVDDSAKEEVQAIGELRNKLLDRLVQGLHDERKA